MINEKYGLIEDQHVEIFEDLVRKYGKGIVLDLGCGDRDPTEATSKLVGTLVCVDGSQIARELFSTLQMPENTTFVSANLRNMPFDDNYADLGLLLGVYDDCMLKPDIEEFIALYPNQADRPKITEFFSKGKQKELLQEFGRVIKPSGRLIASNRYQSYRSLDETLTQFGEFFDIEQVYEGSERYLLDCVVKIF